MEQKSKMKRLYIGIPIFLIASLLLWYNIEDENGFNVIWRYFGWANQTLACFTLWTATVWLSRNRKGVYYLMTMLPAVFLTSVSCTYICIDKIGFRMPQSYTGFLAVLFAGLSVLIFYILREKRRRGTS